MSHDPKAHQKPKGAQKANTVDEPKVPEAAEKNVNTTGSSHKDSIVDKNAEFHPDAMDEGVNDSSDDSIPGSPMEEDVKPRPDEFYLKIYERATPDMFKLKNANSAKKVMRLNEKIEAHNLQNSRSKMDFLIPLNTIANTWVLYEEAEKNNQEAQMNKLAEVWAAQVERDYFPTEWKRLFSKSQSPAADGGGVGIQLKDSQGAAHNGGIKTKVGVQIRDESDGHTLLGKVCFVKKCGYGSRVFVNCGTEKNPLYKLYIGSTFGGAAKEWVRDGRFLCDSLSPSTPTDQIKLMAWICTNSAQYYVVHVNNKAFLLTKSMLLKWLSNAQLKVYNPKVEYQMIVMENQLRDYRNMSKHPDTGKRLTSQNIQDMPWLCNEGQDESEDDEGEDEDENENED